MSVNNNREFIPAHNIMYKLKLQEFFNKGQSNEYGVRTGCLWSLQ